MCNMLFSLQWKIIHCFSYLESTSDTSSTTDQESHDGDDDDDDSDNGDDRYDSSDENEQEEEEYLYPNSSSSVKSFTFLIKIWGVKHSISDKSMEDLLKVRMF